VEATPAPSTAEGEVALVVAACSRVEQHAAQQLPRRAAEQQARTDAVQFASDFYRSCRRAAPCLNVSPRTLMDWKRRQARGELTARLRGRPCREPTPEERVVVEAILEDAGPSIGVPTLQLCYPKSPRCVLSYLVGNYRREFLATHREATETLHWHQAGAVWAMDHSEPSRPIDGCYSRIFAVRDLASGMQLAWTPVHDATAEEALAILEALVRVHGPPLVLKSDNGSAFTSAKYGEWLNGWGITSLFSPVRMPRYNGACEAGIGAAKLRTEQIAAHHNRHGAWSADDLYAAQCRGNECYGSGGFAAGTPAGRVAARTTIDADARDEFIATVSTYEREMRDEVCATGIELTDTLKAVHHRRAVRQVLVEHGYLDITHRSIPQLIPGVKCARIT
jgi:transposase InsO family protein